MFRLMSTVFVIDGSAHSPSTIILYVPVVAQSATTIVSLAEVVSPAGGVTLAGSTLVPIPEAEPGERLTAALKLLTEVI